MGTAIWRAVHRVPDRHRDTRDAVAIQPASELDCVPSGTLRFVARNDRSRAALRDVRGHPRNKEAARPLARPLPATLKVNGILSYIRVIFLFAPPTIFRCRAGSVPRGRSVNTMRQDSGADLSGNKAKPWQMSNNRARSRADI